MVSNDEIPEPAQALLNASSALEASFREYIALQKRFDVLEGRLNFLRDYTNVIVRDGVSAESIGQLINTIPTPNEVMTQDHVGIGDDSAVKQALADEAQLIHAILDGSYVSDWGYGWGGEITPDDGST